MGTDPPKCGVFYVTDDPWFEARLQTCSVVRQTNYIWLN